MDSGGGAGTGVGMGGRERGRRLLSSGRGGSLVEHCWRCHIVATNCDQMNPKKRAASGRIQSIPLRNRRRYKNRRLLPPMNKTRLSLSVRAALLATAASSALPLGRASCRERVCQYV